jgi:hypothetical protein
LLTVEISHVLAHTLAPTLVAAPIAFRSDIHEAQEEHTRAQAAMMKKMMPSAEHEAAAREAADKVRTQSPLEWPNSRRP